MACVSTLNKPVPASRLSPSGGVNSDAPRARAGLKSDLALAKAEIATLRADNRRPHDTLRRKLGQ